MKHILVVLIFIIATCGNTMAQSQLEKYPEGFFMVTQGNGRYTVCCNQIGSYFKVTTPDSLKPTAEATFQGDDYTLQIIFVNKSRLVANTTQDNFSLVQAYIDWEKSYLEKTLKKSLKYQINEKNDKPAFAIWSYALSSAINEPEKSFYYYTTTDGNLVVSLVFQFFKKTDWHTFNKSASEMIRSFVFVPNPINPSELVPNANSVEKQVNQTKTNSKAFFEGRFMLARSNGLELISTDASSLTDLFKAVDASYEEINSTQRIVIMVSHDPLLQKKDETRLLFEKRIDENGAVVILSRIAYNGVEADDDDLHQTAQLLFESSLIARSKQKNN